MQAATTTELNLADYFKANNMKYEEMKFPQLDQVVKAYEDGKCDTLTADVSQLYALRLNMSKPNDQVILPDVISKEPLAPVVRQRDDDWMMIVKWTLYAMINAEELGVTSKNIDEALKSKKPDVMRLVGNEGTYGPTSASPRTGRCASSSMSAITARSMSAMSAAEFEPAHSARPEPALERRRHPIRAADPVVRSTSSLRGATRRSNPCPSRRDGLLRFARNDEPVSRDFVWQLAALPRPAVTS